MEHNLSNRQLCTKNIQSCEFVTVSSDALQTLGPLDCIMKPIRLSGLTVSVIHVVTCDDVFRFAPQISKMQPLERYPKL
jgi:hypothetical protein